MYVINSHVMQFYTHSYQKKLSIWREEKAQNFAKETEKLQREEREAKEKEVLV